MFDTLTSIISIIFVLLIICRFLKSANELFSMEMPRDNNTTIVEGQIEDDDIVIDANIIHIVVNDAVVI